MQSADEGGEINKWSANLFNMPESCKVLVHRNLFNDGTAIPGRKTVK
jgi:hypothetical protein